MSSITSGRPVPSSPKVFQCSYVGEKLPTFLLVNFFNEPYGSGPLKIVGANGGPLHLPINLKVLNNKLYGVCSKSFVERSYQIPVKVKFYAENDAGVSYYPLVINFYGKASIQSK
jgi:hypothetical protein